MTTWMKRLLPALALLALVAGSTATAQFRVNQRYWTIGGTLGVSGYAGDLTNSSSNGIPFTQIETLRNPGFEFGVQLGYRLNPRWSVRGSLNYILLRGSDEKSSNAANRVRNLSFENGVIEFSGVLMYDLLPPKRNYRLRRLFEPYIFGGIAVGYSDPRAYIRVGPDAGIANSGFVFVNGANVPFTGIGVQDLGWQRLRPLRTEGQATAYSPIFVSVPFGVGVRYKATERINIGLEANFRFTFTDFIDDVSGSTPTRAEGVEGNYPLAADLGGDVLRLAASNRLLQNGPNFNDRRGSKFNDWYGSLGINVSYILDSSPGGVRCPKPSRGRKKGFLGIF